MDRHPKDLTTDEDIERAFAKARELGDEPRILEAAYRPGAGLDFLMLRLSDGRRLLVPREELSELQGATAEQAQDITVGPNGVDLWWPQLDDGLYLPDFLEHRWGKAPRELVAA